MARYLELVECFVDGAVLEVPVGRDGDEKVPRKEGPNAQQHERQVNQAVLVC